MKSDMINNNPKIKNQSKRFTSAYFFDKEKYRNKLLEKSNSARNILIKKQKMLMNFPPGSPPYANYLAQSKIQGNKNLKNKKNLTDFWSLRYDKEKEDEQIYFLKKQNLSQIKKLIDETLKLREKGKYKKHEKYVKKEEEKIIVQKEYITKRDKEIKQREKLEHEITEINKKKKEKDFNNEVTQRRKKEEIKERKILEQQEKLRQRQQEWESKNFEHLTKVENMYEEKHNSAINEYMNILKKGIKRNEKIEERKNEFNLKTKIQNQKRYIHYINYKNKTMEEEKDLRIKLEKKHKNISDFYLIQKEKRNNWVQTQRQNREEKMLSNIYKRMINKNKEIERRKKLLDLFERHEEKIEKCFILKEKKNEEFKLNNLLKSDEITGNYLRNKNILSLRNKIKIQKMKDKNEEVNNKILKRQNTARVRIARYDQVNENKNIMLEHAKQILEERKEYNPEDIYKKVFTNEEINILKE
jgi:hypothetical protein